MLFPMLLIQIFFFQLFIITTNYNKVSEAVKNGSMYRAYRYLLLMMCSFLENVLMTKS